LVDEEKPAPKIETTPEKPAPLEETTPKTTTMAVKKAPEFIRPLVTEMELPEGGVAK